MLETKVNKIISNINQLEKLNKGKTNDNFLYENKYIIKKYSNIAMNNEQEITPLVTDLDVEVLHVDKEFKISSYIQDGKNLWEAPLNDKKIIQVAEMFKKLHNKGIKTGASFNPIQVMELYLSKISNHMIDYSKFDFLRDEVQAIYPKDEDLVLCHNDCNFGNWLFSKDRLYLIDWEYSGMNDPLFDVVCFLSQNSIFETEYKDKLIKEYFKDTEQIPWNKINIWYKFQTLLWAIWANMMYDQKPNQIYIDIHKAKMNNLFQALESNSEE